MKRTLLRFLAFLVLLPAALGVPVWAQSETFTNFLLAAPGGAPTNNDVIPCVEGSGASFATKQCTPPQILALLTAAQVNTALGGTALLSANNLLDVASTSTSLSNLLGGRPLAVGSGGTGASTTSTAAAALGVNSIVQTSTQNGLAFYSQTGTIGGLAAATNGQLPIGRTGNSPALGTLSGGYGTTITNGSGAITSTVALTATSTFLAADVLLNSTGTFFDGPSLNVGSTGQWYVSGTVLMVDTGTPAGYFVELWDGSTVIASSVFTASATGVQVVVSLSGLITSPAGNLRMSVKDNTSVNGKIRANASQLGRDSTVTAVRMQ